MTSHINNGYYHVMVDGESVTMNCPGATLLLNKAGNESTREITHAAMSRAFRAAVDEILQAKQQLRKKQ